MRRLTWLFLLPAMAFGGVLLLPRSAEAGLAACGNIDVKADAKCEVTVKGGCETQCTPIKFEAACAAKFETMCEGMCSATVSAECTTSCKTKCAADCTAMPAKLDCAGECKLDCDATCSAKCASDANSSECQASCKACCGGRCDGKCTGTPPTATCDAKCDASCQGSCQAQANVDCQVKCQSTQYASCKTSLSGGCKTQCEKPEGALFCDGNYVDTGDNLKNCIDALNAYLNIKVEASASGSSSCDGGTCEASGQAQAKISGCSASPSSLTVGDGALLAGVGGFFAFAAARRRKRAA